jgi:glycosyltransferase involved in cell wall biosynthesis
MELNSLKVIHILSGLYQGGAESQLEKLISHSRGKNVEHIIISLKSDQTPLVQKFRDNNITVYCLGFSGVGVFSGFFKLIMLLKKLKSPIMVIQCWMYHANLFGLLAARFAGLSSKVVWNIRRTELPKGTTGMISKLAAKLSFVSAINIVCCAAAAKKSHIDAGYNAENMLVIHNGIDVELFHPDEKYGACFREEIGLSVDDFIIGMVGRYAPIKGHIYLLQAFKQLLASNELNVPSIKLVLIGRDIADAEILQPFITDMMLVNHLIIVPERADIYKVMPAFNLLCLPSKSEGFPNVVAEAMACGVPALVTDVGDAAVIVGAPALVLPPLNFEALSEKMLDYINLSQTDKTVLAKKARARVCHYFSVESAWQKYDELYQKIIGSN